MSIEFSTFDPFRTGETPKPAPDQRNPKDLIGITKPPLHLVPPALVLWVSQVFKLSALEYGPFNWRENKVLKSIYIDAILRHTLALLDGQWLDPKTKLPHVAHIAANVAIILDAEKLGNLIDDMPWKPGPAAALIAEMTETRTTMFAEDGDSRGNR